MPLSSVFSLGNCSSLLAATLALGFPRTEEIAEPGNVVPVSCVFDPNVHFAVCAVHDAFPGIDARLLLASFLISYFIMHEMCASLGELL